MDTKKDAYIFLISNIVIITIAGYTSFAVRNIIRKKKGETPLDMTAYLKDAELRHGDDDDGGSNINQKFILQNLHAMTFGYIQGAISVLALLFGLHYLHILMPKNKIVKLGLGETYGNVFSIILGVLGEHIFRSLYGTHDYSIWADPVGALLGGLTIIGIASVMHLHVKILN